MKRSPALIFAVVLLLLPVLYVGSYVALLKPSNVVDYKDANQVDYPETYRYRFVDSHVPETIYWPLEQIDRRVRPSAWGRKFKSILDPPIHR